MNGCLIYSNQADVICFDLWIGSQISLLRVTLLALEGLERLDLEAGRSAASGSE